MPALFKEKYEHLQILIWHGSSLEIQAPLASYKTDSAHNSLSSVCLTSISEGSLFFCVFFYTVKSLQTKDRTHINPCTALESTWNIVCNPHKTTEMELHVITSAAWLSALISWPGTEMVLTSLTNYKSKVLAEVKILLLTQQKLHQATFKYPL